MDRAALAATVLGALAVACAVSLAVLFQSQEQAKEPEVPHRVEFHLADRE